jgi:hypothetical protein
MSAIQQQWHMLQQRNQHSLQPASDAPTEKSLDGAAAEPVSSYHAEQTDGMR